MVCNIVLLLALNIRMSEARVNSEDIEMVFQRLRALSGNKVNILEIVLSIMLTVVTIICC